MDNTAARFDELYHRQEVAASRARDFISTLPEGQELAQILYDAAFPHAPEKRGTGPAPVYIQQAATLLIDSGLRRRLLKILI